MKLKTDNQPGRNDWMIFAFGATAILAGALALAKGASFFRGPARVEDAVAHALNQNSREPNDVQRYVKAAQEVAAALKEKNLFIVKPPREHPVKQVDGILGNEAFIGGKWYKAGAKIGDAVILVVESTQVRIEWDGQEKTFPPLAATSEGKASQQAPPETRGPAGKPGAPPDKPGSGPKPVKVERATVSVSSGGDSLGWMGVELPPRIKEKLIEHWNNMSGEEQEKARRKWNSMPPEEKERAIEAMKQHM